MTNYKPTSYQPTPATLARGLDVTQIPPQMETFAGDTPVTTQRGTTGSSAILQWQTLGRNASGLLVPWNPEARGAVGDVYATGVLTYAGVPTAADTVTIGGHVITAVANTATPTGLQYKIGTDVTSAAANITALIEANVALLGVTATSSAGVVTLVAAVPGTVGNAITTTESGSNTSFGAGTLANGTDVTKLLPEAALIGVAAQPAAASDHLPYFDGGCFNWKRLILPPNITSLPQLKAYCDGRTLTVGGVL